MLIPAPVHISGHRGCLLVRDGDRIQAPPGLADQVDAFIADLAADGGPALVKEGSGRAAITVHIGAPMDVARAVPAAVGIDPTGRTATDARYALRVAPDGIAIRAADPAGVSHAFATLRQLVAGAPIDAEGCREVAGVRIVDGPRLAWRAFLLDVARCYYTLDEIFAIVDVIALYKLNVLQLHLADNEAWRIEMPGYAALTAGGEPFYSRAEMERLRDYCAARGITLLLEIDLPGHCIALLRAYPEWGRIEERQGRFVGQVDPGSPELWVFVEAVLRELSDIAGSPHVGLCCDEAFRMDPAVYSSFVRRVSHVARARGVSLVLAQEATRAVLEPGSIVELWIDFVGPGGDLEKLERLAAAGEPLPHDMPPATLPFYRVAAGDVQRAVAQGCRVVLAPTRVAYLDTPYADVSLDADQEGRRGALGLPVYSARSVQEFYEWEPETIIPGLDGASVAGVKAAMWADTVSDAATMRLLSVTRIPGFAERAWSPRESGAWEDFAPRLGAQSRIWDRRALGYFRAATVPWAL
ncbi:family 20 glycosylhydrolase [Microbacterium sp. MYb64]|uniref:family 20 glycosylhydrolase n=1 Tax=Microbacterium sp. MYb64 TaxID=1848691 RepID=UPI0015E4078E|nr:family 20 glycosylhydrolase [Microbacterium sp. MYb64]